MNGFTTRRAKLPEPAVPGLAPSLGPVQPDPACPELRHQRVSDTVVSCSASERLCLCASDRAIPARPHLAADASPMHSSLSNWFGVRVSEARDPIALILRLRTPLSSLPAKWRPQRSARQKTHPLSGLAGASRGAVHGRAKSSTEQTGRTDIGGSHRRM